MALNKKLLTTLTMIACLSNQAFAQALKASTELTYKGSVATAEAIENDRANTLSEVYQTALEKNIPYLLNDKNYQAVLTRIAQAKSHLKPQVSADGHVGYNSVRSGGMTSNYSSASVGLDASWTIYSKELHLGVDIAQLDVQMAERQLVLAQQELMGLIAKSYLALIIKEDQARLAQQKVNDLSKLSDFTKTRINQGVVSKDQSSYVDAELRRAQLDVDRIIAERDDAHAAFQNEFGISFKSQMSAVNVSIPAVNEKSRAEWLSEAENNSIKLQIQQLALEIARKDIKKAQSLYSPTVTLGANVSKDRGTLYNGPGNFGSERSTGAFVGVFINIPLYDGGLKSAVTKEQVIRAEAVELEREQVRRQARFDAELALNHYTASVRNVEKTREIISITKEVIQSTRATAEAGNMDFTKMLLETSRLYDYKLQLAQANAAALNSFIQLKMATGGLQPVDLEKISASLHSK